MSGKLFSNRLLVGTTDWQVGDAIMGAILGAFVPIGLYFDRIQKSVWGLWQTNKPNYKKWYSLQLNVELENGIFLFPQGEYTIDDIKELPNEPKRLYAVKD